MKLLGRTPGDPVMQIEQSDVGTLPGLTTIHITQAHVGSYVISDETWSDYISTRDGIFFSTLEDADLALEMYGFYLSYNVIPGGICLDEGIYGTRYTFDDPRKMLRAYELDNRMDYCGLVVDGTVQEVMIDYPLWHFTGMMLDDPRFHNFLKPDRSEGRMECFFEDMWNS